MTIKVFVMNYYIFKKIPLVTTIHHPISKDLKYELKSINSIFLKILKIRWHSFLVMQKYVAKRLKNNNCIKFFKKYSRRF